LNDYINEGGVILKQDMGSMKGILNSILTFSNKVKIIDPYFSVSSERYMKSLELICEIMKESCDLNKTKKLEIHTSLKACCKYCSSSNSVSMKNDFNDCPKKWKKEISKFKIDIEIFVWNVTHESKWHDRFLITDIIGLNIGKGLDVDERTPSTWSIIKQEDRDLIEGAFNKNSSLDYKLELSIDKNLDMKNIKVSLREIATKLETDVDNVIAVLKKKIPFLKNVTPDLKISSNQAEKIYKAISEGNYITKNNRCIK
jgi:hypothetical protein